MSPSPIYYSLSIVPKLHTLPQCLRNDLLRMISYEFRIKTKVVDPAFSVKAMGTWIKTKKQIMDMFPNAGSTPYARELEIFGMKEIWTDDWLTKISSLPSIDRIVTIKYKMGTHK